MGAVGALDARAGIWVLQTLELGTATSSMGIIRGRGAVGLITSRETEVRLFSVVLLFPSLFALR